MQGQTDDRNWMMQAGIGAGIVAALSAGLWAVWYLNGINADAAPNETAPTESAVAAPAPADDDPVERAARTHTPEELRAARWRSIERQRLGGGELIDTGIEFLRVTMELEAQAQDGKLYRWRAEFNNASEQSGYFSDAYRFSTRRFRVAFWDSEGRVFRSFGLHDETLRGSGWCGVSGPIRLTPKDEARLHGYGLLDTAR